MGLKVRFAILAVALCVCASVTLWGQGTTATILGTVADMSGAAIPDAMVQAKNAGTGVTQSVAADAQGRFRISDLGIGDYDVQATKVGFSTRGVSLLVAPNGRPLATPPAR